MREILFRGKRADNGEWIYGSLLCFKGFQIFDNTYNCWMSVKGETVGQYTGLEDKNGMDIFEGDIVNIIYSDINRETHFTKATAMDIADYELMFHLDKSNELEVIGNIHDNPELTGDVEK